MSTVWLVSGTRELTPGQLGIVRAALIERALMGSVPDLLVHGDCDGADRAAASLVTDWSTQSLPMPAQWKTHGNSAGPKRNTEMVTTVSALARCGWEARVFAFPRPDSRGTRDLIRKAQTAGLSVVVTELGGGK